MSLKSWIRSWLNIQTQEDIDHKIQKLEDHNCLYVFTLDSPEHEIKEYVEALEKQNRLDKFEKADFMFMSGVVGDSEVVKTTIEDLFPRQFCDCGNRKFWDKEKKETYCPMCEQ